MLHRLAFVLFFLLSLSPNTFAKKEFKDFHQKLFEDIEKTKGNEHIYRKGRFPASVEEQDESQRTNVQNFEEERKDKIQERNTNQNSTGLKNW